MLHAGVFSSLLRLGVFFGSISVGALLKACCKSNDPAFLFAVVGDAHDAAEAPTCCDSQTFFHPYKIVLVLSLGLCKFAKFSNP